MSIDVAYYRYGTKMSTRRDNNLYNTRLKNIRRWAYWLDSLLQNVDSMMEFPQPLLKNGRGKYAKNMTQNYVSENGCGIQSFHNHYKKPSWKLRLSRPFSQTVMET